MNLHEAIDRACSDVGIQPPKGITYRKWLKTDTLSGKSGKGDGRVIVDDAKVVAWNWQTQEKVTVWLHGEMTPIDRRRMARRIEEDNREKKARAERAARLAAEIVATAVSSTHPYLAVKGFRDEKALVIGAEHLRRNVGDYIVAGERAIVMPARIGSRITSVQLVWEDGTKKFLAGGEIGGSCHRIAKGTDTWLCEGLATGLSLRAALKSLRRSDTVLCCFSASNLLQVSRSIRDRCLIVADHDKPLEQFGGKGTGEHYAEAAGRPYLMPPTLGDDLNDMHMRDGIYAVQRLISDFIRTAATRRNARQ